MNRNKVCTFILSIILFVVALVFMIQPAKAETTTIEEAYQQAPQGIKFKDYLTIPKYFSKTGGSSNAFLNTTSPILDYKTNIIQMLSTSKDQELGAVWGNIKDDGNGNKTYDYFDLTKEQEVSAWFFVDGNIGSAPDGLAFVLQNDPKKTDAISRDKNGNPTPGQTLGYGEFQELVIDILI